MRNRDYYRDPAWDQQAWVDIISIEYERLVGGYPFKRRLSTFDAPVDLLDVGCGTAIFPTYLDQHLSPEIRFTCDLLDLSRSSLDIARNTLASIPRYEVRSLLNTCIEEVPAVVDREYDLIWAIHSFTTVEASKMEAVLHHLREALRDDGLMLIYQLTSESSYQRLHRHYREHHPNGQGASVYMQFEETRRLLDGLGAGYGVTAFQFEHQVPDHRPEVLKSYLRKCILDDEVDTLELFADMLPDFHDAASKLYRFPQAVNLLEVKSP